VLKISVFDYKGICAKDSKCLLICLSIKYKKSCSKVVWNVVVTTLCDFLFLKNAGNQTVSGPH